MNTHQAFSRQAPVSRARLRHSLLSLTVAAGLGLSGHSLGSVTYTLDADFAQGTLLNLNYDPPNGDQLQLNESTTPFPFVNIAASQRGTIVKIHTETGQIVGEYLTAPDGRGRNPSRTTVDQLGNTWVGNRNETSQESPPGSGVVRGSVARIGLILGGTRVDGDGNPDPDGDYLAPPFEYNTCVDRDGDGLIRTSRGLGDIPPWTNDGGADNHGGVSTAQDECIIAYTRAGGGGTRALAIDAGNDLWVSSAFSGQNLHFFEKVSGVTGDRTGVSFNEGCGGYGAVFDNTGVLWAAGWFSPFLRFENPPDGIAECIDTVAGNYGIGIDPTTQEVWMTDLSVQRVVKLDRITGAVSQALPIPFGCAQGITVDGNSHVWAAQCHGTQIAHWAPDPSNPGQHILVGSVGGLAGTTGVAVDAAGKIWVSTTTGGGGAARIDPEGGPLGCGGTGCGDDYKLGAIDLTVSLGAGAGPYNYSDMTGFVAIGATVPLGSWTVVHDGGEAGIEWGLINWNTESEGQVPEGASLMVSARAAETQGGLSGQAFGPVANGAELDLVGRFIEVRVELRASPDGESPVLSDLSIMPRLEVDDLLLAVDIRPNSCPNPFNQRAGGVLPVAILGTPSFDVAQVNPASVRLEGVAPNGFDYEDVETPFATDHGPVDHLDCSTSGPDGFMDLTLKFDNQEIAAAISPVAVGDILLLRLEGELNDGTPFTGEDIVIIVR